MQSLDSVWSVTRALPQSINNLLTRLSPTVNQFTAVWEGVPDGQCIAQVVHQEGDSVGQMTFLATDADCDKGAATVLLESLIQASGRWGARHLVCDLPSNSDLLPAFRRADYCVWAGQKLYRLRNNTANMERKKYTWRTWQTSDLKAVQALHCSLVPKLFQSIEPVTRKATLGMVVSDSDGTLLGYADFESGPRGIWILPMLSPKANDPIILQDLLDQLPTFNRRPVYFCARSYMPMAEELISRLDVEGGADHSLLVRYLVIQEKQKQLIPSQVFEKIPNEGGVPVTQARNNP